MPNYELRLPIRGIRISLGPAGYRLRVSNGNGPFVIDDDGNKVMTTRIAPTFLLGDTEVTAGPSGLQGIPNRGCESRLQDPGGLI